MSALVLQTVRSASATGLRIERHVRSTLHDRLDVNALRHAVAGTLVTYSDSRGRFSGTPFQASGVTARGLGLVQDGTLYYSLSIEDEGRGSVLYYEEAGNRFEIVRLAEGAFSSAISPVPARRRTGVPTGRRRRVLHG